MCERERYNESEKEKKKEKWGKRRRAHLLLDNFDVGPAFGLLSNLLTICLFLLKHLSLSFAHHVPISLAPLRFSCLLRLCLFHCLHVSEGVAVCVHVRLLCVSPILEVFYELVANRKKKPPSKWSGKPGLTSLPNSCLPDPTCPPTRLLLFSLRN